MLLKAEGANLGSKGLERKSPNADNCFFLCVSLKLLSRQENVGSVWPNAGNSVFQTHVMSFSLIQLDEPKCVMDLKTQI